MAELLTKRIRAMAIITLDYIIMPTNYYILLFLVCSILAALVAHSLVRARPKVPQYPPSPPGLPIIGHLHILRPVLPKCFQALARRYGPLMSLRIGASSCVVASTAAVAKEIFKTQELNFSSRPEFGSSEYFIYRGSRFVLAQYGGYWRFMKKLCMTRLLAVPQLDKFADVREEEKIKLVENVRKCWEEGRPCDLSTEFTALTNNIICRMAMSTRCSGGVDEAVEIKEWVKTCFQLSGKLSVGDILGPLKFLDFSGTGKKLQAALYKFDGIVERIIREHEEKAATGFDETGRKDLLDILLQVQKDPTADLRITTKDIKSFLLDIFMAGTDTASLAMQWAMGELMNNPKVFKKLREEIHSVVGTNRLVKESDIPNLPYLRAIIHETLRLHPSAPLIIRECEQDCTVSGFLVKAKSRVLVNVYAVMRDPESWTEPEKFMPERFIESSKEKIGEHQMEFKGQNFRYLPFGSGRRGCIGASLAMLIMHAVVGSMVQCFDWKLVDDDGNNKLVDLSLGSGFAAEMAKPLICNPLLVLNRFD